MDLRKLTAGFTAAAITSLTAVSASAALVAPENPDAGLNAGTGQWIIQLYNIGSEAENKPATDYGIDYSAVAKIGFTVKATEPDWFDGGLGGAVTLSCNGGDIAPDTALWDKYNWPQKEYWGVSDEDLEIVTIDENKPVKSTKVGDYTYEITSDIWAENPLHNGDASEIGCMQASLAYWGSDMSDYEIVSFTAYDNAGNALLTFDGSGRLVSGGSAAASAPAAGDTAAASAPAAGDTAAAADSSKGSPDTGIEDVAAITGLAVLAGGAAIIAAKRK